MLREVLLGAVQGLAEFVPVSSSGHLVIVSAITRFSAQPMETALLLHVATALAALAVFLRHFREGILSLRRAGLARSWRSAVAGEPQTAGAAVPAGLYWLMLLSLLSTGMVALPLSRYELVQKAFASPHLVAALLSANGLILWWTDRSRVGRSSLAMMKWWHALVIGAAQGAAVFPGISRLGLTLCAARACGIVTRDAVSYSIMLSVPTILLGAAHEGIGQSPSSPHDLVLVATAVGVAFMCAILGIAIVRVLGAQRRLTYLGCWCWVVAAYALVKA